MAEAGIGVPLPPNDFNGCNMTSPPLSIANPPSSSETAKPRVAVIGGGHLGRIHAKLLAEREDVELVAVCDPSDAARNVVESQLGLPTCANYESLERRIDAAVIASPTIVHHQLGRWCLERGIHTLIEKPIACTVGEAEDLIACAEANQCRLQVGHIERFNPVWTHARDCVSPDSVFHIDARREGVYTGRSTDIGIVLDLMIHDIDLILSLVGQPIESIRASGRRVLGQHEDFAIADLVFRNGATAHLRASRISAAPVRAMEIHSSDSWVSIDFAASKYTSTQPSSRVASGEVQADTLPMNERLKVKDELFTHWLERTEVSPPAANAMACEHSDFIESILSGRAPIVSGRDGARSLRVACEIAEQIASQSDAAGGIIPASRLAAARRRAG